VLKIEVTAHNIEMFSKWEKKAVYKREESINAEIVKVKSPAADDRDKLIITARARDLLKKSGKTTKAQSSAKSDKKTLSLSEEDKQKILLLEAFLSKLKGKKVKLKIPVLVNYEETADSEQPEVPTTRNAWQINYSLSESYHEEEKISFSSKGKVKTADGREINFNIKLNMSREFSVENNINLNMVNGRPVDPIVINYAGQAAEFKEETFEFDLTADGNNENIPLLAQGSGFLVLADDVEDIKDGSQLFGPETGDGFGELSAHDEDNNGWIDSGDSVFDNLKIWTRDEAGNDRLFALADKNVGAVYLGNINADYSYKAENNQTNAVNKKLGIYLGENGSTGTVQELDFIV
jgi:hypothetical protein